MIINSVVGEAISIEKKVEPSRKPFLLILITIHIFGSSARGI